jgi:caffeoyl-CoA O-methyltransferase
MMYITEPKINDYIRELSSNAQLTEREQAVLREMDDYARANDFPIIGPLAGRVLRQLAMITRAERILELGSGYGYSAVWFAGGMKSSGKIICTDGSGDNRTKALQYFQKLGIESRIDFLIGDALDIIGTLDGPFDIILNDINKK